LETAVKAKRKMLTFVLPTEKRLVVSLWTFLNYLGNYSELEKPESLNIFIDAGISF